jgi:pre-mRNA-splicing factor SYF1
MWDLLVDMEESIGTIETTKAAYDRMFDMKIITPQVGMDSLPHL